MPNQAATREHQRKRWSRPWVLATVVALLGLVPVAATTVAGHDSAEQARLSSAEPGSGVHERPHAHRRKPTRFVVASFNVLGWKHTARGGRHAELPDGRKRMVRTLRLINRHGVDVVGFQELQPPQLERFNERTGRNWAVYPGNRYERIAMHNSIAWRTKVWKKKRFDYLNIPYFWGKRVKMPVIELRHRKTGRVVQFANFHNPSDGKGNAQRWRNKARRMQVRLADRSTRRVPLVITGDMNERRRYFCHMVGRSPMHAANGGRATKKRCVTPRPMGIDWIFGSKAIRFRWYERVERDRLRRTSDHPFISAAVKIRRR
ncbi:MAG TPA: endonuclease/exonuclease/phosphatase family protein [Marmoricola sp.]|nr:endonuclease/exonuclease/phosphatase family protein [Marmoricola sp.]